MADLSRAWIYGAILEDWHSVKPGGIYVSRGANVRVGLTVSCCADNPLFRGDRCGQCGKTFEDLVQGDVR